ncbi:toll/interleukin-1 receptor domain-containing protein [Azoarcus olearius]|uniref:Hypothetical membrane protein n=1 Tax=Azoarcus sp. (strain BH72) TaxID=418699 RepID=A1KBN5_AZOSB|nr:toll/interleukin-1 receptor domain-containing protein [Azoarcus olearius]CAL96241.1 hypothetical membrane protein [Azoarcus olearius]
MARLFVSYRREDAPGHAGRVADGLEQAFGAENVFRDVDDIAPGADFAAVIDRALAGTVAVVVVIGPNWLAPGPDGVPRLAAPDDFVRHEIELALAADKPLLPVLVNGARMPAAAALPSSIRGLAERQAIALGDLDWKRDFDRLRDALAPLLGAGEPPEARRVVLLAGVALAMAALGLWWWRRRSRPPPPEAVAAFAGEWEARVIYPWGDSHDERFELVLRGAEVHGRASFLGLPRNILGGRVDGRQIEFFTETREVRGDEPARRLRHRYRGELPYAGGLRLTLETRGGYDEMPPVSFTARRVGP